MADQPSNETLKQMLSGFSAMQYNLGLLPMQQSQAMAGASSQFQAPPPPPPIAHPADAAIAAMSNHNNLMQQTLQAAQMTRYMPPPSAPTPALATMSSMAPLSGGSYGGGSGGGGSYGGGGGPSSYGPRLPSIFNPFAPTLPTAHFASPAMRNLQLMQHASSQSIGMATGIGEAAAGIGGSTLGGAIGSVFGPLGSIAGSYLGGKVGGAIANMVFNPAVQDMARGRQVQAMTSPFMVSGAFMNTSGQGMSRDAGVQTATGIRHLQRDHDFERTGFNTQDTMKIMQMSADAGLMTGLQSPDQLVQKVKAISKQVKTLMRITGDPDVRDAIQSLGQMRDLGFQGLGVQGAAISNRAVFARQAGMSQAQMHQAGVMGADAAGQFGLAGATGYSVGMAGTAAANMAASSGALGDLALSRAGGRGGLGAINTQAALAGIQNEQYLLAASRMGKGGKLEVDMDAYRRTQSMSFDAVQKAAADHLRELGTDGIFKWNSQKQEVKDQLAQQMKPGEAEINFRRQARAYQQAVPGMDATTAIQAVASQSGIQMSTTQARAYAQEGQSGKYWDAQMQQTGAQRHAAVDQERAKWEQYRTPGLMTRMRRGVSDAIGDASDAISSPFKRLGARMERTREDEDAAKYGEHIERISDLSIAHDDAERRSMQEAIRSKGFQRAYKRGAGGDPFGRGGGNGIGGALFRSNTDTENRLAGMFGMSSTNNANRIRSLASESYGTAFGMHPFGSFGDVDTSIKRVESVIGAARAIDDAGSFSTKSRASMMGKLQSAGEVGSKKFGGAESTMDQAAANIFTTINGLRAGRGLHVGSASALSRDDLKKAVVQSMVSSGMSPAAADKAYEADSDNYNASLMKTVMANGTPEQKEVLGRSKDIGLRAGAIRATRTREGLRANVRDQMEAAGLEGTSEETLGKVKSVIEHHDSDAVAIASARAALRSSDPKEQARAKLELKTLQDKLGSKYAAKSEEADQIGQGEDDATKSALAHMATGGSGGFLSERITHAKTGFDRKMAGATMDALMEKVVAVSGKKDLDTSDPLKAVRSLSASDLDRLEKTDPELAKQLRAAQKGSDDDGYSALSGIDVGPTSKETAYGGSGELDGAQARLRAAKKEFSEGDGTDPGAVAKLTEAATDDFATAVKDFAAAVKDLKGSSDTQNLANANPWVQAFMPGVR